MKYFEHWRGGLAIVGTAWLCLSFGTTRADTITVGETTYEDVLVLSDDASYSVLFPDEGTTLVVGRENVDESQVKLSEDQAGREELKRRYNASVERIAAAEADASVTASGDVAAKRVSAPALTLREILKEGPLAPADAAVHVVEFWATWCGPCRRSTPYLSQLQARYAEKGIAFIGVTAESPEVALPYVTEMGDRMNYTVAADYQMRTSIAYASLFNVGGIPHVYIVGREGKIRWHGHPMELQFLAELEAVLR